MVTVTYETLTDVINALSADAATAEAILMQAAYRISGYGYAMTVISGVEGARTGTYTAAETGWLIAVAVQIYVEYYKSAGASSQSFGLGGISTSQSTSQSKGMGAADALAKEAAERLTSRTIVRT